MSSPVPARTLGFWTTCSLVVGNMVGSGVFLLPASLAPYGRFSLYGWLFSSGGALLLAWVFSRLARRLPRAGGPYAYTRAGFGDFAGFLVAWGYWICILSANAAIVVALVSYLSVFFPVLGTNPASGAIAALGIVWLLTLVNGYGVVAAGRVQLVTTVLKLLPLLAIALAGLTVFEPERVLAPMTTGDTGFSAITACTALTLWAFMGLESATIPAEHVQDAARTIPRATLVGTLIAAGFYVVCTTVAMGIVPSEILASSKAPFADAARVLWGEWGAYLIAAGAAVACFGTLNGWILMQGQLPFAVARDGLFPAVLSRLSTRGTPVVGLVVSSALVSALVMANYTRGLVHMFTFAILLSTMSTLVPYLFSTLSELILARADETGRAAKGVLVVGVIGAFAFTLWAVAGTGQEAVYWGTLLLLAGLPVYVWQKNRAVQDDASAAR